MIGRLTINRIEGQRERVSLLLTELDARTPLLKIEIEPLDWGQAILGAAERPCEYFLSLEAE